MRILVVDDEPDLCEILCFNLESEGYKTDRAYSAEEALSLIASAGQTYYLILLDVMMESMSGFEMARRLRAQGDNTPIIFITAKTLESDQLEGFASGADDYIAKPFSFPTVLARVRAVLKRSVNGTTGLHIDPIRKTVSVDGAPVSLTKKEYMILSLLMSHKDQHFTRQEILDQVWDDDTYVSERSVDVHIARLRKKLGKEGDKIVNHSGFGYILIR